MPAGDADIREAIGSVLTAISDATRTFALAHKLDRLYLTEDPVLRAVSSLAEGADRVFAEEARARQFRLFAPLPFTRAEYEKDFASEESVSAFRDLLQSGGPEAAAVFELDGSRDHQEASYEAAARFLLNQSDLLVAVWDGRTGAGAGGTEATVRNALASGVPVVWISSESPHRVTALRNGCAPLALGGPLLARWIGESVAQILDLPAVSQRRRELARRSALEYLAEPLRRWNPAILWDLLHGVFRTERLSWPKFRVEAYGQRKQSGDGDDAMRVAFEWADVTSRLCGDAYRSGYLLTYFFAAVAVFFALVPTALAWRGASHDVVAEFAVAELTILLVMIASFQVGRWRRWHGRWLDCRLAAELIRQARVTIAVGGAHPAPRLPLRASRDTDPGATWMLWYVRALIRSAEPASRSVTPGSIKDRLDALARLVGEQLTFHSGARHRSHQMHERIHVVISVLLCLTAVLIVIHLLPFLESFGGPIIVAPVWAEGWLTLASATMPAMSAALAGIDNQAEFARVVRRSEAMVEHLDHLREEWLHDLLKRAKESVDVPRLGEVVEVARDVSQLLVDEVADWRVIFVDRPQTVG